jgi:hypothetical protein
MGRAKPAQITKPGLEHSKAALGSCMESTTESEIGGVPLNCGIDSPFDVSQSWDQARASISRAAEFLAVKAESLGIELPFDFKYNCGAVHPHVSPDLTPRMVIDDGEEVLGDGADDMPFSARPVEEIEGLDGEDNGSSEEEFDKFAGIDDHIQLLRRDYPALVQHSVVCLETGVYKIGGRAVEVYFDWWGEDELMLMVRDGPLTQPFLDYVFDTGENETFDVVKSSTKLVDLPEYARLQVKDTAPTECRLTAMKTAKKQAAQREAHAKRVVKSGTYFHSP